MTTISVTSEFREEFEAERLRWLRRRFLWYTGVIGALGVLDVIGSIVFFSLQPPDHVIFLIPAALVVLSIVAAGAYVGAFLFALRTRRPLSRATFIRLVVALIVVNGLAQLPEVPLWSTMRSGMQSTTAAPEPAPAPDTQAPAAHDTPPADAASADQADRDDGPRITVSPGSRFQFTATDETGAEVTRIGPGASWIFSVFITHLLASLFIPWTPRESVRPLIPLLALNAIVILLFDPGALLAKFLWIALSPLIGLPGVAIAWWRHSRFRSRFSNRMLKKSYGEIKRELTDARRIHEALFPEPLDTGPVQFRYVYEPMRQIGGDFLFARCADLPDKPQPLLNLVVIDVTGHGISAALTVNRLHGEIEREFGENPAATPGEVLHGLNAYLHHTLARHSVYATALCLRVDPNTDELLWASAGHPSAFVRTASGRIDQLDSTTFLLGACHANDFHPNQQRAPFYPGDSLLIYTDGATEARNHEGRMLRTEGMQRLIAGIDPGRNGAHTGRLVTATLPHTRTTASSQSWCAAVLHAIDEFRHGPAKDDTLVVEVARPI